MQMHNKSLVETIRDNDPSYDPLRAACERAGVPYKSDGAPATPCYCAARDRVYFDGYYGPLRDADWREQDGREPAALVDALDIVRRVAAEIEDYREEVSYACDACDGRGTVADGDATGDADGEDIAPLPTTCPACTGEGLVYATETTADASDIKRDVFAWYAAIYGGTP